MKILQVVHYFPPYSVGGSELYSLQLAHELARSHDVRLFFTLPENTGTDRVVTGTYEGLPYRALRKNRYTFDRPFHERDPRVETEFIKMIEEVKPDVVHFQHLINLSVGLPRLAHRKKIACCFTLHDFWLLCPQIFLLKPDMQLCTEFSPRDCLSCTQEQTGYYLLTNECTQAMESTRNRVKQVLNFKKKSINLFALGLWRHYWVKKIVRAVDIFIAPSRFLREQYVRYGFDPGKIVFIRHGFTKIQFDGLVKKPSDRLRFAFIGSPREYKGIGVLIEAFNRITEPAELRIYGTIPSEALQELTGQAKNPHIYFMGELRQEDKKSAFAEIDVLIVPSRCYENCPVVINEAFMAKTPVIATALGGMAELVQDGVSGFTFPAGDAEKLAEKIKLFIAHPELKDKLSERLPDVKDMAVHAREILDVYNQALQHLRR